MFFFGVSLTSRHLRNCFHQLSGGRQTTFASQWQSALFLRAHASFVARRYLLGSLSAVKATSAPVLAMAKDSSTRVLKKAAVKVKKGSSKAKHRRMTQDEKRIIREMHFERGMAPAEIDKVMPFDLSNICRLLAQKKSPNPIGRQAALSEAKIDRAVRVLEGMVEDADASKEVTMGMVLCKARLKCCERTLSKALHKRGYWFRTLRKKMILTPEDVKARYEWAKKYKGKPKKLWLKRIHVHLDNHHFKVATTVKSRSLLAKRRVRGVYRQKQKSLRSCHVKPDPKLRLSTGAKGILKLGGVGGGRVLVWHTIKDRWGGDSAARAYTTIVLPAVKKRYRGQKLFTILEDNDPTGNLSIKGVEAKRAGKMKVFQIPKRSPDLNVLDYAIWSEGERRMRLEELKMKKGKRETREQFEARLDRVALSLPPSYVKRSICDLKRRSHLLYEAEGGLFEGGRTRRPL